MPRKLQAWIKVHTLKKHRKKMSENKMEDIQSLFIPRHSAREVQGKMTSIYIYIYRKHPILYILK